MNGSPKKGGPLLAGATIIELNPNDVEDGDRIGFYHPDIAAAIGRLMAVDDQRDPIKVIRVHPDRPIADVAAEGIKPWRRVTGLHRLHGARIEAISIFAIEVPPSEDIRAIEASENADRRDLKPLERAKFTAAVVQSVKDRLGREHGNLKQEQWAVKARWDRVRSAEASAEKALDEETADTMDTLSTVYGWKESAARAMQLHPKEIQRDLRLYRLIIEPFPDLIEQLAHHPLVGDNRKQLGKLAGAGDRASYQSRVTFLRRLA